ncbi:MAG: tRNA pseudouridine(55) synthase TruB [Bullifex sp.]
MSDFSILLLDKVPGLTSFRSLSDVKKCHKGSKVGHTGTLDRFASGLMIVLTGEATKLTPLFSGMDKSYRATIALGSETDTLDPEGATVRTSALPSRTDIENAIPFFLGEIMQVPPVYSAIHVNGKRAYERIRKGEEVEMEMRPVTVHRLTLECFDDSSCIVDTRVSKGTYIRSLARDLAEKAGSCGHLTALDRYEVGPYSRSDVTGLTSTIEESERLLSKVCPLHIDFSPAYRKQLVNGFFDKKGIIGALPTEDGYYRLRMDGAFSGVVHKEGGRYTVIALTERD